MTDTQLARGVTLRERRGWWHVRFYDRERQPRRKEVALDTQYYPEAVERARDKLRRYQLGQYDPWHDQDRDLDLADVYRQYKRDHPHLKASSLKAMKYAVRRLRQGTARTLRGVTPKDLQAIIYKEGIKPATRRKYWREANVLFRWATEAGYVRENPMEQIQAPRKPRPVPKYYSEDEVDRLVEGCRDWHAHKAPFIRHEQANPAWLRQAIEVIAGLGLRRSEAARLRWRDVDLDEGLVAVRSDEARTKNDDDGLVTLRPRTRVVLQELLRFGRDAEDHVLKGSDGRRPIDPDYTSRQFKKLCLFLGMPCHGLHGLRHSFAAHYLIRGGSLKLLQDELRHRDFGSTLMYASVDVQHRKEATRKLFEDQ